MEDIWWKELADLDEDQKKVIELSLDGNYLVKGPPGSGKTNLLLLRANYFIASGKPNIAIVVFTRALQEFLRSGTNRYEFDENNVTTSAALFNSLLREAGHKIEKGEDFDKDRQEKIKLLKELRKNAAPYYDCIFLDEAQDYQPDEIAIFQGLAHEVFFVADSRQRIYMGDDFTALEDVVDEVLELNYHYRNGMNICRCADKVGENFSAGDYQPILPACHYNEESNPSTVDSFKGNLDQQIDEVFKRVTDQRRLFPDSIIGIISPRIAEVKSIAAALEKRGLGDLLCVQDKDEGYQAMNPAKPIWVSTIHSSKGLEFRALHILALDNLANMGSVQKRLIFTGITRTKTSLSLYYEKTIPNYLSGAIAAMNPPSVKQPLEAAFGTKK